MDRFVVREQRTGAEYPQGNQMMTFPANASTGNSSIPEVMYFSGPFASEPGRVNIPQNMNAQLMNAQHNMNAPHNFNAQPNMNAQPDINALHNMSAHQNSIITQHNMNAQSNMSAQTNMCTESDINARPSSYGLQSDINARPSSYGLQSDINVRPSSYGLQSNMSAQHNTNAHFSNNAQHNMSLQMAQSFGQNSIAGPGSSGIDPRYLAGYSDNSAQFIINGQQIQRNATPINNFGGDYQNRGYTGIDRNKQKSFASHIPVETSRVEGTPRPQPQIRQVVPKNSKEDQIAQKAYSGTPLKKPNELDLPKNDIQNQIVTRADKLKALHRSGPRSFSGPVEKVLKWHKSLQDIGVLIFYEIVAKCVSVRAGESCSKNLVVRDDSGPAMQVVYYEIDFLLPELKVPCTIRVIGRMMAGTCRLQAFHVRPATGDDVATLPRRAAVAAHHVAKLCKEYGANASHA